MGPSSYLSMPACRIAPEMSLFPHRLHGAPSNDYSTTFFHHLGKVDSWIQQEEFEAALTNSAWKERGGIVNYLRQTGIQEILPLALDTLADPHLSKQGPAIQCCHGSNG